MTASPWLGSAWIEVDWPPIAGVRAGCSTRLGGVSAPPYDSFNLATHVGDDPASVAINRRRLVENLALPKPPHWLEQVHGTRCLNLDEGPAEGPADAAMSRQGQVCAVMTADCLPVLIAARDGSAVAAVHAGWRGLQAGVIERALEALAMPPQQLQVWLGPMIGPTAFEVGAEVRDAFVARDVDADEHFVAADRAGHWFANLPGLARQRLRVCGVSAVFGGDLCTHNDGARFFSYRRDGRCGRMVSLIWQSK